MPGSSFAGPLTVGGVQIPLITSPVPVRGQLPGGRVRYVCNRTGVQNGNGRSATRPYATIEEAVSDLATGSLTSQGDCIYVLQGHAENVDEADWLSELSTLAGLSIVGVGTGTMRPRLTWTLATSTLLMDTANLELANFNLYLAGAHAAGDALTVAAPITVSGAGCRIINNFIYWGFDADQIVGTGIIWTGTDGVFANNRCIALVAAQPTECLLRLPAAERIQIVGNYIFGPTAGTTVGVIKGLTTASLNVYVGYNYLHNILASSTIAMSLLTGSTGEIQFNMASVESGILPFTASIGRWHQNHCVDSEGQAGALVGTAST